MHWDLKDSIISLAVCLRSYSRWKVKISQQFFFFFFHLPSEEKHPLGMMSATPCFNVEIINSESRAVLFLFLFLCAISSFSHVRLNFRLIFPRIY